MQDKTLLHGLWNKLKFNLNDCWRSCGWIKPTFLFMVKQIRKKSYLEDVNYLWLSNQATTFSSFYFLVWLHDVFYSGSFLFLIDFFFFRLKNLYSHSIMLSYAFVRTRCISIVGKKCGTYGCLMQDGAPPHVDIPVCILHGRPSYKSRL